MKSRENENCKIVISWGRKWGRGYFDVADLGFHDRGAGMIQDFERGGGMD